MTPVLVAPLLQLTSTCLAALGTVFFAIGVLAQNRHALGRAGSPSWKSDREMTAALAGQKAEYVLGAYAVGLSFLAQAIGFALATSTDPAPVTWPGGVAVLFAAWGMTALLGGALYFLARPWLAGRYRRAAEASIQARATASEPPSPPPSSPDI